MPTIKSSADLRNGYNEISSFCHTYSEPVFITKNGKGNFHGDRHQCGQPKAESRTSIVFQRFAHSMHPPKAP